MAVTIIHELVHGIQKAIDTGLLARVTPEFVGDLQASPQASGPCPYIESFFEDEQKAELGFSRENFVFTGSFGWQIDNVDRPMFIHEWPNKLHGHLVSMHSIYRCQRQDFWDAMDPRDGKALYVTKSAYIKFRTEPDEEDVA